METSVVSDPFEVIRVVSRRTRIDLGAAPHPFVSGGTVRRWGGVTGFSNDRVLLLPVSNSIRIAVTTVLEEEKTTE
jgi:hypothetical protein